MPHINGRITDPVNYWQGCEATATLYHKGQ